MNVMFEGYKDYSYEKHAQKINILWKTILEIGNEKGNAQFHIINI